MIYGCSTSLDAILARLSPCERGEADHESVPVIVYEPTLNAPESFGSEVSHDLDKFKAECDVIAVNRWSDDLADAADMVYSRDLVKRD